MNIKNKYIKFVIIGFVLFFCVSSYLITFHKNNDVFLEKVNLKIDNKVNKNIFAVMIQKEDGSGYEESNTFPSNGTLNMELSGCIDSLGNKIPNALSYSGGVVNAEVDSTAYCYLYFDIKSLICNENSNFGDCLLSAKTNGFNSSIEAGMYRYQGTSADNYVCFGTKNKNECINNEDKFLYRIIGVTEDKKIKVIKKTSIGEYQWWTDATTDKTWPNSLVYTDINGSTFLNNENYILNEWKNIIVNYTWKYGLLQRTNQTASSVFAAENSWTNTISAKIGLMYATDYYYSQQPGGYNCGGEAFENDYSVYEKCSDGWIHLRQNDSSAIRYEDPIFGYYPMSDMYMSRLDYSSSGKYIVGGAMGGGGFEPFWLVDILSVRPVFYMESDLLYSSGLGTIDDPLIIDFLSINPTVSADIIDNATEDVKITLKSNISGTYCVNTSSTLNNMSNCVFGGSINGDTPLTTNAFTSSGVYYVHVKDSSGNFGITNEIEIKVLKNGLGTSLEGGLYRYQGTTKVNNYICFGTNDRNTCLANKDLYLYRIIGITEDGKRKVIKNNALESTMQWHSSYSSDITWPNSDLYNAINGSSFLTNTTYVPSSWSDIIEITTWKYGDFTNIDNTASAIYNIENAWTNTVSAKIGLMYAHDYYYAYQSGGLNCYNLHGICKTSWINLKNSDLDAPSRYEWTMSRYGEYYGYYYGYYINPGGLSVVMNTSLEFSVRPVFYLKSTIEVDEGTGSLDNPYIITGIRPDTQPPTNNSVSINNGATSTTSTSVTLTLASTGATEMCISNTTSCSSWEPYATSKSHTLTSEDGTKTVYVWYRDEAGNTTSYVTDTILLSSITYVCTSNTTLGTCLNSAKTAGFNSTMEGGLYRYQGTTNVNNYVCFGTTDKSTCTGNTDAYMYRIIGIDSSNQVKLLKKEALNGSIWWGSSSTSDQSWGSSGLYYSINGSTFLTNTTYIPSGWSDKIATISWKHGGANGPLSKTAGEVYNIENSQTGTVSAKVGLMYVHDYFYAYQSGGLNCHENSAMCKTSWMHLSNNDTGAPSTVEWTMFRATSSSDTHYANIVDYSGTIHGGPLANKYAARPVFFLTTSVKYISGSGTASDPFIIS